MKEEMDELENRKATDLATWARGRSRDAASTGETCAAQCYEAMARTIEMALDRLNDPSKAERWQWGVGKR